MFTIELKQDEGFMKRLPAMGANVHAALKKTIYRHAVDLQRYIIEKKLSASAGYSADQLHRVTGNLSRSIQQRVVDTATGITAYVFSAGDVKYAAIHEYGGSFTRFGKRAGDYTVHIPQRSFMRSSLAENKDEIIADMNAAVLEGIRK